MSVIHGVIATLRADRHPLRAFMLPVEIFTS